MKSINTLIKTIDSDFMRTKIVANPTDYKFSMRLLSMPTANDGQYYALYRDMSLLDKLSELLGVFVRTSGSLVNCIDKNISSMVNDSGFFSTVMGQSVSLSPSVYGWFVKEGNVYLNQNTWVYDMLFMHSKVLGAALDIDVKQYYNVKNSVQPPLMMYLAATGNDSIALPLLYSMIDLTYAMSNPKTYSCADYIVGKPKKDELMETNPMGTLFEGSRCIAFDAIKMAFPRMHSISHTHKYKGMVVGINEFVYGEDPTAVQLYKVGAYMTLVYGCELLYRMTTLSVFAKEMPQFSMLLKLGYDPDSFVAKHLYTFDMYGDIMLNDCLVDEVFVEDNTTRFNNIIKYAKNALTISVWHNNALDNKYIRELSVPAVLGRLVQSMHDYAWRQYDDQTLCILYEECKSKGLDTSSLITTLKSGPTAAGLPTDDDDGAPTAVAPSAATASGDDKDALTHVEYEGEAKPDHGSSSSSKRSKKKGHTAPPNIIDIIHKDIMGSTKYRFEEKVVRDASASTVSAYNAIADDIKMLDHLLVRKIKDIKTFNTGGKNSGLTSGKIDMKNLWHYKSNPAIFCNNTYKIKEMDLAFAVVLDRSGSMSGSGIINGRISMILIHEALRALGVDHMICAHDSNGMYNCRIKKYWCFKNDPKFSMVKPYALSQISAGNGNCDSGSLFYAEKQLMMSPHKDKICIIFSDGEPTECTDKDLHDQVDRMEKEGIHVIGIGIDFPEIAEYYPDNANGKTLNEMVNIISSILERYVLERKDT